jgi:hypothetical protein
MKTIGIIRNRGKFTIPDSIRKKALWADSMSAVSITLVRPNKIVIEPQQISLNWEEIWSGVAEARAITGSGKGNRQATAKFLEADRKSH